MVTCDDRDVDRYIAGDHIVRQTNTLLLRNFLVCQLWEKILHNQWTVAYVQTSPISFASYVDREWIEFTYWSKNTQMEKFNYQKFWNTIYNNF